ncbi:MAG: glycosyltransferase family 4 protein, partial [Firmicutes bacterium]|nr:glycosyltransferase family 4 protein [Bacillota bacterium]
LKNEIEPFVVFRYSGGSDVFLKQIGIPCVKVSMCRQNLPYVRNFKEAILFLPRLFLYLRYNFLVPKRLINIINKFQPDIIHTNVGNYQLGYRAAKKMNVKHVWHLREFQGKDMDRWIIGGKKGFIKLLKEDTNTYPIAITKIIADYFKISHEHVVYNGIRKKSETIFIPQKKKYFLFVGRISKEKGVLKLVEAFCKFAQTNKEYSLLLAGKIFDYEYKNELKNLIKQYDDIDKERIQFLGEKNEKEVNELMSLATALIVTSYHEAFGRIVAEAMFNGCLVIGNNIEGIKEQFDNGLIKTGEEIGIRYNNVNELSKKMEEVTTNGILYYIPMIERSQQVVKELYTVEEYCQNIYKVYCKVLNISDENIKHSQRS